MTPQQLDVICANIKPTQNWQWFLVKYNKIWLGGKIRQVGKSIEFCRTQIVHPADVQEWKDYENARNYKSLKATT